MDKDWLVFSVSTSGVRHVWVSNSLSLIVQDERGSEVYLGTSLMGIDVRPAAGHTHVFYRSVISSSSSYFVLFVFLYSFFIFTIFLYFLASVFFFYSSFHI